MVRILFVATLVAAALFAVKDGRLLERAGLLGSCRIVAAADTGTAWYACRRGRLSGWPDLGRSSCESLGVDRSRERWRCPSRLASR